MTGIPRMRHGFDRERKRGPRRLVVHQSPLQRQRGLLAIGPLLLPVAIGRAGMRIDKREGDGATPIGRFRLLRLWRRPESLSLARCGLPMRITRCTDLWCDASGHRLYNRPASAPLKASHEEMWRADSLYDAVVEIDWNIRPRITGRGSAIFMHLARDGYPPTAGCVALAQGDMRKLLPLLRRGAIIVTRR
jgi:L,D-peptidoglycan transpeptidase YkuD (ErfK/YbiS/YcfS/YnhG family)